MMIVVYNVYRKLYFNEVLANNFGDVKTGIAQINSAIATGNQQVISQIYQSITNLQSAMTQQNFDITSAIKDCCCNMREAISGVNANILNQTNILQNQLNQNAFAIERAFCYKLETLHNVNKNVVFTNDNLKIIAYARVSSHDQKDDLVRQMQVLELYCAKAGFKYEVIQDLGCGMNYYKKGLTKLLNLILDGQAKRLVLTHKDRLLRFRTELVFAICEAKNVEVIIINKGNKILKFEEELAKDVLEIITVFSARLYGSRSKKNKKLLEDMQGVLNDNLT